MPLLQSFAFPNSIELRAIEQVKLPARLTSDPSFSIFPFEGAQSHILEWTQEDSYGGMQQMRGLNGKPPRVTPVGERSFMMKPGVYGEHMAIDELEMTVRAARAASLSTPVNIDDLVTRRQDQLLTRRLNRISWTNWQLLVSGILISTDTRGAILQKDAYEIQFYKSTVAWSSRTTATPLEDLSNVGAFEEGQSVDFGGGAIAYMNRITAQNFFRNSNPEDLGGMTGGAGQPARTLAGAQIILTGEDLPNVVVFDGGYYDESLNFVKHIPDGKVVVVGRRESGTNLGNFRFTLNVNNPGSEPAPYTKVIDHLDTTVPRLIEVHDGFNGGPVLYYPGSVVVMDVT